MVTKQTLLPFKIVTFLLFFTIGDSIAQNDIQVVIQNDASEYPTLLFNYFKKHKATFDSCGLHFAVKLEDDDSICNGMGLYCTFLLQKDAFACIIKNCQMNLSTPLQQYDYNSTTEKSDSSLLAKWEDDLLNLLFQIDTSLITKVTNFKPLSVLLKNKNSLLTHDNFLKNSQLCDLLDDSVKVALQSFAKGKLQPNWKLMFLPNYKVWTVLFNNQCGFKCLKYLTNIRKVELKDGWTNMEQNDILYLKNANVSIVIVERDDSRSRIRADHLRMLLLQNAIEATKITIEYY